MCCDVWCVKDNGGGNVHVSFQMYTGLHFLQCKTGVHIVSAASAYAALL